jgi:hypothetical protein
LGGRRRHLCDGHGRGRPDRNHLPPGLRALDRALRRDHLDTGRRLSIASWNSIFTFWFAYVVTRPLGASFADWVGKPTRVSGLGWGDGRVSLVLTVVIACLVACLVITHKDVQGERGQVQEPR